MYQNKTWGFIYAGIGASMLVAFFVWDQVIWLIFAMIMVILAGIRLFWLEKKHLNKE